MFDKLTLGVCYYPEHWEKSMWADDLERMKSYGLSVIRIGEFAWNKFEPEEGRFTFDFFDEFIALAEEKGMKVILGTPTATPPAWLTTKYPEVLNADVDGNLIRHGMRRHASLNSPKYIEKSRIITEKLAEHYGDCKTIVGWQIDNEINCEKDVYYSESDHAAFAVYLKEKYKTLDALNDAMGTVFWNQTYTDWNQVRLTQHTNNGSTNPHMALEEKRFISDTCVRFIRMQAKIIRKYAKNAFVTTNGLFAHLDYHSLIGTGLDFITYDNYPNFAYGIERNPKEDELNDRDAAINLTRSRSISGTFGIMEQQSGAGGWNVRLEQPMPKPGQIKLWALEAIAEGADFVSFFRWRTCTFGTEIYWHGLNDYSNRDNRRLRELKQVAEAVERIEPVFGSKYQAQAVILQDYDNEWDGECDVWHGPLSARSKMGWVEALEFAHIPYDFCNVTEKLTAEDLKPYQFAVYAHPAIMTAKRAKVLEEYVAGGGILVVGSRAGYKDLTGKCTTMPMPGYLAKVLGAEVEDYTFVSPEIKEMGCQVGQEVLPAPVFNDILNPLTAKVLGTFTKSYYAGEAALTENVFGAGKAYYFGGGFDRKTAEGLLTIMGIVPVTEAYVKAPESVQVTIRRNGEKRYLFLMNYKGEETKVVLNGSYYERIRKETLAGEITMAGYEVLCLEV